MASMHYLKKLDKAQLFRLFVDGRFQRKYQGWLGYEAKEPGSVQAILNGFAFMLDNFFMPKRLTCTYLRNLHRVCMSNVVNANPRSSAGDIRYLNTALPFFVKTTTYENIVEVLQERHDDGTEVFYEKEFRKTANKLNPKTIFEALQKNDKLNYKAWYPNINTELQQALDGEGSLLEFYDAKHFVQISIVRKMEKIVERYNLDINQAGTEDEKLTVIALLIRQLELLHPFPDGNCRVFACVLLTQLLLLHGFPPAMLTNPNLDAEYSLDQWIDEIKAGMERTQVLLEDPNAALFNFSTLELSAEQRATFLTMAAEVIKKIAEYNELYLTPQRLAEYTSGTWFNAGMTVRYTAIGSYETYPKGCVYFAMALEDWIKAKRNVREELQKRVKAGIRAIVLDDKQYLKDLDIPVLLVANTLQAFEDCAAEIRQAVNPKTVLVTGTEGKTGSKIQLHHLLKQQAKGHAVLNSGNANIPVLRSLNSLKADDQFEINEVSVDADQAKSIRKAQIVNPDICFFTNIGKEHMHNHKTIEGVIQAKACVVEGLRKGGKCIVNSSLDVYAEFVSALKHRRNDIELLTYGYRPEDSARLISANFDSERFGWIVNATIEGLSVEYFLPLIQQHAPLMSVGILLAVKALGFDVYKAAEAYVGLQPFESMGLLHRVHRQDGDIIFYDQSRRASISGVRSAFKDLRNLTVKGKTVALIGSISSVQDNEWTKSYHEELADLINKSAISRLYTTGPNMQLVHDNLENKAILVKHSEDLDSLYEYLMTDLKAGDLLFIMGYMRLNLDKIAGRIVNFKADNFYKDIENLNLTGEKILQYKIFLVSAELNKGVEPLVISKRYGVELSSVEQLKASGITYRNLRTELLINFFKKLDLLVKNEFDCQCVNQEIKAGGYEALIYNERYCNQWFNNFDKIAGQAGKSMFGSFYYFGDKQYLLTVLVGTTNLHIGFAKYQISRGKYELLTMDQNDSENVIHRFGANLPGTVNFNKRSWGYQWTTVDLGSFIDFTQARVFATVNDFERGELYTSLVKPLLLAVNQ